ncbi:type IV secretory system conjugative DNA transfer family protein [Ruegeria atlantica]|uniref:type IV secretory system conjugative DNA transfer family protein n=1 Tax=Ruegeria atlantica TaxID=81569 RepID=UPI00147EAAEB|nr:type IV secretory system conjugative DNA transfer family protein [Ruegeria atlantica]
MTGRPHRIGRLLRIACAWLADHMIRTSALIPLALLLATWVGFQQNAGLYLRGALHPAWYDATLIAVLVLPPLAGHLTAWLSGHRSGFWWLLWLPAVALYWLRPWHTGTEWTVFWREHLNLWNYFVEILKKQEQAPLRSFVRLGGMLTMALITFMMLARSWLRFIAWLRKIGRDTGEGTVGGLPQATWADAREVRDTFSHNGGIVLGEHTDPLTDTPGFDPDKPRSWKGQGKGHLITMNPALGNGHVVVLAPSAGYKTAGIVIPNILHYDGPLVVIDPKGDLHARTREARAAKGFTARVIDARHGFDPFRMIAPLAPEAPSVYLTMARTLMPLADRASDISEYFHEMSTMLFAALMGHFIAENSTNVAGDISAFINRNRDVVIKEAQSIAARHNFPFINDELEGLALLDERTFPGVVKGISNKLAFTRFPDVASFGQSGDSPDSLFAALGPKSDIFINFPTLAAEDFSSFPRLLIGAIYVASELTVQPDRPRARRLFLIDEARILGGMNALNNIRDAGRSIGLHLMLIYQSYGQLTKAWGGEAGAAAWLDSCEARVISAVGSSRTANDIVTMLGRRTLRTRVQGSSASSPVMTPMGGTVSSSEQEQIREVPLMSVATLGQLPAHGSIIFTRRSRPVLATKAIFFTREKMAPLVKSPDAVANELEATRRRDTVLSQIRDRQLQNLPDPQPGSANRRREREQDETILQPDAEATEDMQPDAMDHLNTAAAPGLNDEAPPQQNPPIPDYGAKTRKRIAAARAKSASKREIADTTAHGAGAPTPSRGAATRTRDPAPDPDGLSHQDRAMMTMIMGVLGERPDLRGAVTRALADSTGKAPGTSAPGANREVDATGMADTVAEDRDAARDATAQNPAAADPSDAEIEAVIDMLWLEQIEVPPVGAEPPGERETGRVRAGEAGKAGDNAQAMDTARDGATDDSGTAGMDQSADPALTGTGKTGGATAKATRKKTGKPDPVSRRRRTLDANEVREAFDPHIEAFFRAWYGEPARPGSGDWRPKDRNSFSLQMKGPKRGCWYDHSAGKGGTILDLVAVKLCNLPNAGADFPRVLEAAADYAGFSPSKETPKTRKARKQRKEERDSAARAEEQRKDDETAMLVLALRGLAQPVAGSLAETYLAGRHITNWPETGLAALPALGTLLPAPLRLHVYNPEYPALLIWAADERGIVTGGQRILLDDAGRAVPVTPGKPSFGMLAGRPARFPARTGTAADPLFVAEGPETALTLWQTTGHECWAVFGVSFWRSAHLPTDRDVILVPDRDAASSPAGKAFRKAVAHHLERGCRLRVATAPEPEGSKKDLNDTLMEQGIDAVQAALGTAHPPGPDDLPDETDEGTGPDAPDPTASPGVKEGGKTMEENRETDDEQPTGEADPDGGT